MSKRVQKHLLPIRVYYEDTDSGGIVYHANYLKYFERARVEALRTLGIELINLYEAHDAQFVVRSLTLEFLQPARLDQLLYVVTEVTEVRGASIMYNQEVHLSAPNGVLLCSAKIRLACLDKELRPRGLPSVLLAEIKK